MLTNPCLLTFVGGWKSFPTRRAGSKLEGYIRELEGAVCLHQCRGERFGGVAAESQRRMQRSLEAKRQTMVDHCRCSVQTRPARLSDACLLRLRVMGDIS